MTLPMLALTATLTLITGVLVLVAARLVRALRHTVELEQRVARLQEGIHLLADTTETGLRQVAAEIERLSEGGVLRASRTTTPARRPTAAQLRAATRRGRTVKDIAAAEQVSEGEVRLRLSLSEASAAASRGQGRSRRSQPGLAAPVTSPVDEVFALADHVAPDDRTWPALPNPRFQTVSETIADVAYAPTMDDTAPEVDAPSPAVTSLQQMLDAVRAQRAGWARTGAELRDASVRG